MTDDSKQMVNDVGSMNCVDAVRSISGGESLVVVAVAVADFFYSQYADKAEAIYNKYGEDVSGFPGVWREVTAFAMEMYEVLDDAWQDCRREYLEDLESITGAWCDGVLADGFSFRFADALHATLLAELEKPDAVMVAVAQMPAEVASRHTESRELREAMVQALQTTPCFYVPVTTQAGDYTALAKAVSRDEAEGLVRHEIKLMEERV